MTESNLLIVLLVLCALMFIALFALVVLILRRLRSPATTSHDTRLDHFRSALQRLALTINPLVASAKPPDNVVSRLTFRESLDPERFATTSRESACANLTRMLAARAADGTVFTINSLVLASSGAELVVSASLKGQLLYQTGLVKFTRYHGGATGPRLAQLRWRKSGRIMENLKEVRAAKALRQLGAMSTMVVAAAHIVSAADIAIRLDIVDKKLDLLLSCRRIDQMARLERIYAASKELLSGQMNGTTRGKLHDLRLDLLELRAATRMELQQHFSRIEDPQEAPWLSQMFTRTKTADVRIHGHFTEGQVQLALLDYSLRLDQALAVASETVREYETTLAGELHELRGLAELLQTKADLISGKHEELAVKPTVDGMFALVEQYTQLLPETSDPKGDGPVRQLKGVLKET